MTKAVLFWKTTSIGQKFPSLIKANFHVATGLPERARAHAWLLLQAKRNDHKKG